MGSNNGYFQCRSCGFIHKEKIRVNIEEMFVELRCPRCRGETQHNWVGDDPEDVYLYADVNLDERYYKYDTR